MLSTIETEHIMKGDSVELSEAWLVRKMKADLRKPRKQRGTALTTLHLLNRYGMVPYYAMKSPNDISPRWAFMLGEQYTPLEFAHSVNAPLEYVGLCSTDAHPYYTYNPMDSPDNWTHDSLWNVPPDSLQTITEQAVRHHHGVCWEGDISEKGFQWKQGVARPSLINGSTTDDHCMAIVGIASDKNGDRYFIMKNSWGTENKYNGLIFMHFDYFRKKTVAVVLPRSETSTLDFMLN
jgi:bleomycin hydrolase